MAALLPSIQARIKHLKTCKKAGLSGDSYMKMVCETRTIILTAITNYPKTIPVETASALIQSVVEDAELFDLQDRCAIVESVNSKTCQNDHIGQIADPRGNDRFANEKLLPIQSMYNVENYLTQKIWSRLREHNVNRSMVYLEITKLLVQLGLQRPREQIWGHLVGTLQWAMEGRLDNPLKERDSLKRYFVQCRTVMNCKIDAPIEYPKEPFQLLDHYPGLYHRTYTNDLPIQPPVSLDTHTLNVLKTTIGCRSTRKFNGAVVTPMPRHLG